MIAEPPAYAPRPTAVGVSREPLSMDRVTAELQLILAARRAARTAESARRALENALM